MQCFCIYIIQHHIQNSTLIRKYFILYKLFENVHLYYFTMYFVYLRALLLRIKKRSAHLCSPPPSREDAYQKSACIYKTDKILPFSDTTVCLHTYFVQFRYMGVDGRGKSFNDSRRTDSTREREKGIKTCVRVFYFRYTQVRTVRAQIIISPGGCCALSKKKNYTRTRIKCTHQKTIK